MSEKLIPRNSRLAQPLPYIPYKCRETAFYFLHNKRCSSESKHRTVRLDKRIVERHEVVIDDIQCLLCLFLTFTERNVFTDKRHLRQGIQRLGYFRRLLSYGWCHGRISCVAMSESCHDGLEWSYVVSLINKERTWLTIQDAVLVEYQFVYCFAQWRIFLTQSPITGHTAPHAVFFYRTDSV